jgi:single-strand DNA-binding protein
VAKYLTKGSPAFVEGRLRLDQWEDKTSGQKRSRLKIVLDNVQFLGRPGGGGGGQPAVAPTGGPVEDAGPAAEPSSVPPPRPSAKPAAAAPQENVDEDVPF